MCEISGCTRWCSMVSGRSNRPAGLRMMPNAIKILVAGGFGVGKTTLVSAISETRPLHTEEVLTGESVGVDDFERRGTPFIVAVNCFEGAQQFKLEEVEHALNLGPDIPVLLCDARRRESGKEVLITLVRHAMGAHAARQPAPAG